MSDDTGLRSEGTAVSHDRDLVAIYDGFVAALNAHSLKDAKRFVDSERYTENCVGFTPGDVGWEEATASLTDVWTGLPDLTVEIDARAADGHQVVAHGRVHGTDTGKLFGVRPSGRYFEASFFDTVVIEDGVIVRRIQQTDILGQMRQLYRRPMASLGVAVVTWKLKS
jgi:predicted ester cyclase